MIEHYNHFLPRILKVTAVTLGKHVYYAIDAKFISMRLRKHEEVHIQQFYQLGFYTFLLRYFKEYIYYRFKGYNHNQAYLEISFEKEAREKEILNG